MNSGFKTTVTDCNPSFLEIRFWRQHEQLFFSSSRENLRIPSIRFDGMFALLSFGTIQPNEYYFLIFTFLSNASFLPTMKFSERIYRFLTMRSPQNLGRNDGAAFAIYVTELASNNKVNKTAQDDDDKLPADESPGQSRQSLQPNPGEISKVPFLERNKTAKVAATHVAPTVPTQKNPPLPESLKKPPPTFKRAVTARLPEPNKKMPPLSQQTHEALVAANLPEPTEKKPSSSLKISPPTSAPVVKRLPTRFPQAHVNRSSPGDKGDESVSDAKAASKAKTAESKRPANDADVIDLCGSDSDSDDDSDDEKTVTATQKKRASDSSLMDTHDEGSAKKQRLNGMVKNEKQEMEQILKENREMMLSIDATHAQLKEAT